MRQTPIPRVFGLRGRLLGKGKWLPGREFVWGRESEFVAVFNPLHRWWYWRSHGERREGFADTPEMAVQFIEATALGASTRLRHAAQAIEKAAFGWRPPRARTKKPKRRR